MKSIRMVSRSWLGAVLLLSACSPAFSPTRTVTAQPALLPTAIESVTHPAGTVEPASNPQPASPITSQFPDSAGYTWNLVAGGFDRPDTVASAGDSSGRLFVLEQAGVMRVVNGNKLESAPFLDISGRVGSRGNEQGLLGIAFHQNFSQNGYFFVDFTDRNGNTVTPGLLPHPGKTPTPPASWSSCKLNSPSPTTTAASSYLAPTITCGLGWEMAAARATPIIMGSLWTRCWVRSCASR